MAIDKLNIRFNEPIYDQENIDKLKNKVNEVIDETAENASAIASITDEDGNIEAGKLNRKLYVHPININVGNDDYQGGRFTMFIFNNSSAPINTTTLLENYIKGLYQEVGETIRILLNGGGYDTLTEKPFIANFIGYANDQFYLSYIADGFNKVKSSQTLEGLLGTILSVGDGVNEIFPNISE